MKKFLKLFSVFALICCCMFSFAGCNIFEDKEEYAELVAERKIVREVVNNTKVFLQSNTAQEEEPVAASSFGVSARAEYDYLDDCLETLNMFIVMIDAVINGSDFVPGKLYNFERTEYTTESGGTTYHYYYLINAYCGEGDVVTLNISDLGDSKDNRTYATNSSSMVIDIHYNNEHKPTRLVNYTNSYNGVVDGDGKIEFLMQNTDVEDMSFSATGECEGLHWYTMGVEYTLDWTAERTWREIVNVDKNGECTRYEEHSHAKPMEGSEPFTDELREMFEAEMEVAMERTYIYNFARPLPENIVNKIFKAVEDYESES